MKIAKYIFEGTIVLFLMFTIRLIYLELTAEELTTPSIFGYSMIVVIGDSMENTLQENDIIIVKKKKNYQIDDIITFYSQVEGHPIRITHRIIEHDTEHEKYITRGDRFKDEVGTQTSSDHTELVNYDDVVGKVIFKIPWVGTIFSLSVFQNKLLVFILLIIFIILTIVFYILHLLEKRKYIR